jgi:hypothetical protein
LGHEYPLKEGTFGTTGDLWRKLGERFPRARSIVFEEYVAALNSHVADARELADPVVCVRLIRLLLPIQDPALASDRCRARRSYTKSGASKC